MIEYHKIIKEYHGKDNFQVFIFRFDRDDDELVMLDLFLITTHNGYQSKVRIDIQGFCNNVFHHSQKITEEEVNYLYKIMDPILDEQAKQDRDIELLEQEIERSHLDFTETLIKAADMAAYQHPPIHDFEKYAQEHKNSKSK